MKKKTPFTLFALVILATLSSCSAKKEGFAAYWQSWSDAALIEWQVKSTVLLNKTENYCKGHADLQELQTHWVNLALHWAALNGFPFKAISDNNLEFDLYFWPDKRNMIEQAMSKRLTSASSLNAGQLSGVVAAEKGIPAMEWLLFKEEIDQQQRCTSLPQITKYYSDQVDSIVRYHENNPVIQQDWAAQGDSIESDSIGLNLGFQQVAQISNRLNNGFDDSGQMVPILSEGWRSRITAKIVQVSLSSLTAHMGAARLRLDISTESNQQLQSYENQLQLFSQRLTDEIESGVSIELSNPALILDIRKLLLDLESLIEGPLATETGVLIGFNNYDGD